MFNFKKIFCLENYISPIDQFLTNYDSKYPRTSKSQQIERGRANRIKTARDQENKTSENHLSSLWSHF